MKQTTTNKCPNMKQLSKDKKEEKEKIRRSL
jgi:hypothetical protein